MCDVYSLGLATGQRRQIGKTTHFLDRIGHSSARRIADSGMNTGPSVAVADEVLGTNGAFWGNKHVITGSLDDQFDAQFVRHHPCGGSKPAGNSYGGVGHRELGFCASRRARA